MKKILPLILLSLIVFSGCLDKKESFLVGRWEDVPRIAEPPVLNVWAFKDNNTFEIETYTYEEDGTLSESPSIITGQYTLEKKSLEYRLTLETDEGSERYIYNGSGVIINGEYWVEELDRDMLKMTREKWDYEGTPFLRLEMIRL
jgi:hypothetical protein